MALREKNLELFELVRLDHGGDVCVVVSEKITYWLPSAPANFRSQIDDYRDKDKYAPGYGYVVFNIYKNTKTFVSQYEIADKDFETHSYESFDLGLDKLSHALSLLNFSDSIDESSANMHIILLKTIKSHPELRKKFMDLLQKEACE